MPRSGIETEEALLEILSRRRRGAVWKGEGGPAMAGTICEFIPPQLDRANIDWLESWSGAPAAGAVLRLERSVVHGEENQLRHASQVRLADLVTLIDALHIATDLVRRLNTERDALQAELDEVSNGTIFKNDDQPQQHRGCAVG